MKINNNRLDEMQQTKRNKIGNTMFIIMFYALLLDSGFYGMGITWLKYPVNIMVIIMVCMGIYLVSTIAANAYQPPKTSSKKPLLLLGLAIVFSTVLAATAFKFFNSASTNMAIEKADDSAALILFIISSVGLLISLVVFLIKKSNDKYFSDD